MAIAHFTRFPHWAVRMFDFPVKQTVVMQLSLSVLMICAILAWSVTFPHWLLLISGIPTAILLYAVYPYTPLHKKDLNDTPVAGKGIQLRVLSANVYMYNHAYDRLLNLVNTENPDCLLLLETDLKWETGLKSLEKDYPYFVKYPLGNTYGLLFYSKLKIHEPQIRFMLKPDIPSLKARLELAPDSWVWFYGVHPEPPSPTEAETSEPRDIELMKLGKEIRKLDEPVIFMGDFNDVAWSHTTRLFRRFSGLRDPRIGRGSFSTFHVKYPLLRWPLDHCFLSGHFSINELRVLPSIGSDHFPILIDMQLRPEQAVTPPQPDIEDLREVKDKLDNESKHTATD
jgi:endonuclease/exonuclease/phosphatase (EEP) superfamily protein YafD